MQNTEEEVQEDSTEMECLELAGVAGSDSVPKGQSKQRFSTQLEDRKKLTKGQRRLTTSEYRVLVMNLAEGIANRPRGLFLHTVLFRLLLAL